MSHVLLKTLLTSTSCKYAGQNYDHTVCRSVVPDIEILITMGSNALEARSALYPRFAIMCTDMRHQSCATIPRIGERPINHAQGMCTLRACRKDLKL